MLARTFMTAQDLKITEDERSALIKILGMLERGEFHKNDFSTHEYGFNMNLCVYPLGRNQSWGLSGQKCGTVACIGGWVAMMMGKESTRDIIEYVHGRNPLRRLYWPNINMGDYTNITTAQAAHAVSNFLTTGNPDWHLAVSC